MSFRSASWLAAGSYKTSRMPHDVAILYFHLGFPNYNLPVLLFDTLPYFVNPNLAFFPINRSCVQNGDFRRSPSAPEEHGRHQGRLRQPRQVRAESVDSYPWGHVFWTQGLAAMSALIPKVRTKTSSTLTTLKGVVDDENEVMKLLKGAYDRGLNTWDTANVYSNGGPHTLLYSSFLRG
jgi:hypothetical protein